MTKLLVWHQFSSPAGNDSHSSDLMVDLPNGSLLKLIEKQRHQATSNIIKALCVSPRFKQNVKQNKHSFQAICDVGKTPQNSTRKIGTRNSRIQRIKTRRASKKGGGRRKEFQKVLRQRNASHAVPNLCQRDLVKIQQASLNNFLNKYQYHKFVLNILFPIKLMNKQMRE